MILKSNLSVILLLIIKSTYLYEYIIVSDELINHDFVIAVIINNSFPSICLFIK